MLALPVRATNQSYITVTPLSFLAPRRVLRSLLLHSSAAALNQNDQNNNCQCSGNYSDNRGIIHALVPSLFS
jgi:hypothetical protein